MTWFQKTLSFLARRARDEDGATTTDFVIVTAGAVALAIAITNAVGDGAKDHSEAIGDKYDEVGFMTF